MTSTAVAVQEQEQREGLAAMAPTGVYALATMSDEEFQYRLAAMKTGRARVQDIQRAMMREGVHFGKMPNAPAEAKPGLFKPGAELLCSLYNYVPDCPDQTVRVGFGDIANEASPALSIIVRCEVHAGSLDGPVVGVGYGAANSWEVKYRYRNAARLCPKCGKPTIIKSKWEAKGGAFKGQQPWVCLSKSGGCGTEFAPTDATITEQVVGRVTNPDAMDLQNTLLKMAKKRAVVDGTIAATGTSDLFTQDIEDMGGDDAAGSGAGAGGAGAAPTPAHDETPTRPVVTLDTPVPFGKHAEKKHTVGLAGRGYFQSWVDKQAAGEVVNAAVLAFSEAALDAFDKVAEQEGNLGDEEPARA